MQEKLKSFLANDALFLVILLVMVSIISFGLGRQSVEGNVENSAKIQSTGVVFTEATKMQPVSRTLSDNNVQVVGSKSGTKYHLLDCPGAAQMKEENKIFFDSVELAEAAGYTPAANCSNLGS